MRGHTAALSKRSAVGKVCPASGCDWQSGSENTRQQSHAASFTCVMVELVQGIPRAKPQMGILKYLRHAALGTCPVWSAKQSDSD